VSKLSFGIIKGKEKDADDKELPSRPSGATMITATPSSGSSSFFNVSSCAPTVLPDPTLNGATPTLPTEELPPRSVTPVKGKILPPIPRDFGTLQLVPPPQMPTGEVDRDVFEIMGANTLAVRFEINIVKVRHSMTFRCNGN